MFLKWGKLLSVLKKILGLEKRLVEVVQSIMLLSDSNEVSKRESQAILFSCKNLLTYTLVNPS